MLKINWKVRKRINPNYSEHIAHNKYGSFLGYIYSIRGKDWLVVFASADESSHRYETWQQARKAFREELERRLSYDTMFSGDK